ncbi:MAG: SlyX family protein [Pseudomonadota bacterium]
MTEDRLIDLETRLAFQEDTIATLDGVVARQQRQIDILGQQLVELAERLERRYGAENADVARDEPPPHY